jgi:putative SOS response-associated peptidase YedK
MCGRYTLYSDPDSVREALGIDTVPGLAACYNVAPTQQVPVVRAGHDVFPPGA